MGRGSCSVTCSEVHEPGREACARYEMAAPPQCGATTTTERAALQVHPTRHQRARPSRSPVGVSTVVTLHLLADLGDHGVVAGLAEVIGQGQAQPAEHVIEA